MMRVGSIELEEAYTDRGSPVMPYQGQLFTGVAYEISPQGTLWSEQPCADGTPAGVSQSWYPNGQAESRTEHQWNRLHGCKQAWHDSGFLHPQYDGVFELGLPLHFQERQAHGRQQYAIEQDSAHYAALRQKRAIFQRFGLLPSPSYTSASASYARIV